jgi:putative ABC transport system permease protein
LTLTTLILRSATYHWRTNLAVTLGVAAAVAVLAGALVVGDSVRGSLRDLALGRLGRTDYVLSSAGFFRDAVGDDVRSALGANASTPLVVADGFVTVESSGRRAANVLVYGVDDRFWTFQGLPPVQEVHISPALASEVGAVNGDVLLTRLQKPSEIPIESLFGRKEDAARTVRLTVGGVLPRERLGEFALKPQQAGVRAVFAPLRRLQRDLGVAGEVNTVLLSGGERSAARLKTALHVEDLGVRVTALETHPHVAVESASGIVSPALEEAARQAGAKLGLEPTPVFTYLANTIRVSRQDADASKSVAIPYSLVTATDLRLLSPNHALPPGLAGESGRDAIVLNEWAARELGARLNDQLEIEYFIWDPSQGLLTRRASFRVGGVVAIAGVAADRRLAPEYPGITGSNSLAEWDPPFPIDLSRVRPVDERYWDQYRATPKAFISYERGRELWASRYGAVTSIRFSAGGRDPSAVAELVRSELRAALAPQAMGVMLYGARESALAAARGATDFGQYFTYFSFFLVVSALLLAVLFFKLGVEQRLRQIGILRASGYTMATVRRLLLGEAVALSLVGGVIGIAGALAYGETIVHGLRTWWVGAVGTTALELHVRPASLAIGAVGGVVAAVLCVLASLRAVSRATPRALLSAQATDQALAVDSRRARRNRLIAMLLAAAGAALIVLGFVAPASQAGAFFGAGAALLAAALFWLAAWLRARDARPIAGHGAWALSRLGFRSAAFRPSRSVLSTALIASATFIIVSVEAFRRDDGDLTMDPRSGTGGYVLLAEAEIPVVHNANDATGREALMIQAPELRDVRFTRFRVRQGEDASCLNLYKPMSPTIIAPEPAFIDSGRFTFASSLAGSEAERANPWLLLKRRFDDGAVPVIGDATSMQYVLHVGVGETLTIDTGASQPLVLRFVGALRDSLLQSELIIADEQFVRLFPQQQGHQLFLIDAPGVRSIDDARGLAGIVERELQPFGVDATVASERLAAFHRVENTYLSTFQALGGLGLVLGTIGLAAIMFRNVLERRRELALLRAVGYDARGVSIMILAEAALVVGAGVVTGACCAAIAIAPAWLGRGGSLPGAGLAALLVAVVVAGLLSSLIATRAALGGPVLEGLRAE